MRSGCKMRKPSASTLRRPFQAPPTLQRLRVATRTLEGCPLCGFLDLVVDRPPARSHEPDVVVLAADPRIEDDEGLDVACGNGPRTRSEVDERVVQDHLLDACRLLRFVAHYQRDRARLELRLRDRDLTAAAAASAAGEHGGQRNHDGRRSHSTTSKKPIQPSAANSLLW